MNALTPAGIRALINKKSLTCLDTLEVFPEIGSTNSYLLGEIRPAPGRCRVALAEHQTKGRGRREREWISPPSTGLCMSIAFTFIDMPRDFPSLSLAIGVGVAQLLERLGMHGVGLKWPNDIVARNGKLGGILSEVHPKRGDGVTVVVGIGLNIDFGKSGAGRDIASSIGRATDLAANVDDLPSRNEISAAIIDSLVDVMTRFRDAGFLPFHELWSKYDWLRGREVTVEMAHTTSAGIAEGVDTDGALLLNIGADTQRVTSGSVFFRERASTSP
jgi:BirA family biotin operon repressor/biotin-[acetyl-CoA-carboxylase] ligase